MKKRLQTNFLVIAALSILSVLILTTIVFYNFFQDEVMGNLQTYATMLERDMNEMSGSEQFSLDMEQMNDIRVTVITPAGNVLYDSNVEVNQLENHSDRPEVKEALKAGRGQSIRTSSTLSKTSFYYALKMESGNVLRLSKESQSYVSFLLQVSPLIGGISVLLFILSMVLSHLLAKSFVRPIERLADDMEGEQPVETAYKELKPLLITIQKQHEDIVKSSKMRQEFTANVSHELKTPLTSISGYSELIENGMAKGKDVVRFAGEIHTNANRLLTLINDILQLSELDFTDVQEDFAPVDLVKIMQQCVEMLTLNAKKHDITIESNVVDTSCVIQGNSKLLEELIYNLLDNAIRYNREGGKVFLSLQLEENRPVFRIKDTGIGISKEHQERIFERFYRVDKSRSKATGGTGLGLAIVKHIVVCHEADIEVQSEEEKGTEIIVSFREKNE